MLNLSGRGALVSGTRRVGATVVKRLAREGVRIAITYRSSRAEAEALYQETKALTDRVVILQADVSVEDDVKRLVEQAQAALGDLSFLINMASDYPRTPLESLDSAQWEHAMAQAKGNYLLAAECARVMQANEGPTRGHLVFFGDWAAGETPYLDYLPYLTAKASIQFMTRAFALELGASGILVNAIAPGPTALGVGVSDQEWEAAVDATPLMRESSPDDIAEMIATLLKLETITGETIRIDSGRHLAGTARLRRRRLR
ncbi:MAG TPA: SDR family oxidoreductase [Dehalococcoidia bacterium]|nr:SDR family oxidoreductase [Dehalococcoidia bacterium]